MKRTIAIFTLAAVFLAGCTAGGGDSSTGGTLPGTTAASPEAGQTTLPPTEASTTTEAPIATEAAITTAPQEQATEASAPDDDAVVISEKLFIAQTNDIYINTEDYLGKTIRYEGIFKTAYWEESDTTYYFVIRYGPGCCGYDGEAGFEVAWSGDWPEEDDWCEATGILELYEEDGIEFLRLQLTGLTVLETRGAEFVST